jgi:hypothetical protein
MDWGPRCRSPSWKSAATLVLGVTPGESSSSRASRTDRSRRPTFVTIRLRAGKPPQTKSNDLFGKISAGPSGAAAAVTTTVTEQRARALPLPGRRLEAALAGIQERVNLVGRGAMGGEGGRR